MYCVTKTTHHITRAELHRLDRVTTHSNMKPLIPADKHLSGALFGTLKAPSLQIPDISAQDQKEGTPYLLVVTPFATPYPP
jgi:hypothetical protein